jgi:hypothetical protein
MCAFLREMREMREMREFAQYSASDGWFLAKDSGIPAITVQEQ